MSIAKPEVGLIEPMLALAVTKLPEEPVWTYELKFDGYRALGIKANGKVRLLSRNGKDFTTRVSRRSRAGHCWNHSPIRRDRDRWRVVTYHAAGRAPVVHRPAAPIVALIRSESCRRRSAGSLQTMWLY